jgi:glutathione S-transferase
MSGDIELIQFRFSPYNEKVRWALDHKGLAHRRRSLLPGPHLPIVRRLTGQTATPVLRLGSEIVFGSSRILRRIEAEYPAPPLVPTDPEEAKRAEEIERRFDEDWTPRFRRPVLAAMLPIPGYFAAVFGQGASALQRKIYGLVLPLAAPLVRRGNGIAGLASIEDGNSAAREALDFVARETEKTGYLIGARFTVADLAAASCLAPLVDPPHPDMRRPEPHPPAVADWLARWRDHPAADWVRAMYRKHRPLPKAVA